VLKPWLPDPDLFNRCVGPPYRIDERLLRQVTTPAHQAWAWYDPEPVAFYLARTGPKGTHLDALGVLPERRRQGMGSRLLAHSQATIVGGGPCHLFPALPLEFIEAQPFFEKHGFTAGDEAIDLWLPAEEPLLPRQEHAFQFGPCENDDELEDFVEREFPGRWSHDTRWRRREEGLRDVIVGVHEGRIQAFCHTWTPANKLLGPSVFWRSELTNPGGIGPVGVAREARGQRAGGQLVLASLHHLRNKGAQDLTVDWTTLAGFYGRAGFRTWRRYRALTRPAAPPRTG